MNAPMARIRRRWQLKQSWAIAMLDHDLIDDWVLMTSLFRPGKRPANRQTPYQNYALALQALEKFGRLREKEDMVKTHETIMPVSLVFDD